MNTTNEQTIAIIVAYDRNRAIGHQGDMPWRLSEDLKRFKRITMGHPVVMGRKTFESLPNGALPGRRNIVVTNNPAFVAEGASKASSPENALALCQDAAKVFVIGGGHLYRSFLEKAHLLYITQIEHDYPADTWFPEFEESHYEVVENEYHSGNEKFPYPYRFITLKKKC